MITSHENSSLRVLYLVLLTIYSFLLFYSFGTSEMTSDDGLWNSLALDLSDGLQIPFTIESSIKGFHHTTLAAYISYIPLAIHKNHFSIQLFHGLLILLMHAYIFCIGNLLKKPGMGIFFSIIFFFTPSMSLFYGLKSWQLFYLPIFQVISLYYFISFFSNLKKVHLFISMFLVSWFPHFHLSAVVLFPVFFFYLAFKRKSFKIDHYDLITCLAMFFLINSTLIYNFIESYKTISLLIVVLFVSILLLINLDIKWPSYQSQKKIYISLLIISLFLVFAVKGHIRSFISALELLPSNNLYVAHHLGFEDDFSLVSSLLSLEVLFLFLFIFFKRPHSSFISFLFYLLTSILVICSLISLFISSYQIPHQWFVFALIYIFLAISLFVCGLHNKLLRNTVLIFIVLSNIYHSTKMLHLVSTKGGQSIHLASYQDKKEILDIAFETSRNPIFIFPNVDWFGRRGWEYLIRYYKRDSSTPLTLVVIFENFYLRRDLDQVQLDKYKLFNRREVRSHIIFTQPFLEVLK